MSNLPVVVTTTEVERNRSTARRVNCLSLLAHISLLMMFSSAAVFYVTPFILYHGYMVFFSRMGRDDS